MAAQAVRVRSEAYETFRLIDQFLVCKTTRVLDESSLSDTSLKMYLLFSTCVCCNEMMVTLDDWNNNKKLETPVFSPFFCKLCCESYGLENLVKIANKHLKRELGIDDLIVGLKKRYEAPDIEIIIKRMKK